MNNNKKNVYIYILKIVIFTVLFFAALYFENAQQKRLIILIASFIIFIANNIVKYFVSHENKLYIILFLIDLVLIYILELNSRLLINYFLHSFYIIILLESSITLSFKNGMIVGVITIISSLVKFIYLIYYKFNLSNISQLVFFLIINILILVAALFAQYNKKEKEKKDLLYKELLEAHKRLKEYTDELHRLSVVEERNRIARDIHDNLGHNMTALIMQLQMTDHFLKTDLPKSKKFLESSINTARDSLDSIRDVVKTLRDSDRYLPEIAIKDLVQEFSEKTGTKIELNIKGKMTSNQQASKAIYHILQEGLTNAVRHGRAAKICVKLDYSDNLIAFSIKDNGIGTQDIVEGYGIKGIKERVKVFKGNVEFKSQEGFTVDGIIYLEEVR